jgi:hypothetical protein
MSEMRVLRRRVAAVVLASAVAAAGPVRTVEAADPDPVAPMWETAADGGQLADEVGRFAVSSPSPWNNPETILVTGGANKPAALQAAGVSDVDVVTTAFDAGTGEHVWSERFDGGLGVDDLPAAFEINGNNNLVYVTANSGADAVVVEHAIRDGAAEEIMRSTGTRANDSAISPAGGFMGVVGAQGGQFFVRSFGTGSGDRDEGFVDTAVAGEALSADIASPDNAPIGIQRTLLVTGRESGFGTGGDAYTAAYDYRTFQKLWERRWASDGNRRDEGVVATAAWARGAGKGLAFVAGRTLSAGGTWDIFVTAYDLATGAPAWGDGGVRLFDGEASRDDEPVAVEYVEATRTVYVAGVSDRGVPHGDDVVVLAFDALTGERKATAHASGDAANGDDRPTALATTADGTRVLVAAEVQNRFDTGGRRAGLFAFDADLHPAGRALLADGAGGDPARAAGVAVSLDGARALLAGSTDESALTGHDHRAAAFPVSGFEVEQVPTTLAFTADSATSGQYTDTAVLEVRLTGPDGPLAGHPVSISLGDETATVTTDADGLARAGFLLDDEPGPVAASARFEGDAVLLPATATGDFTIDREDSELTLDVAGKGSKRTLTARLADADTPAAGIGGREIVFTADGSVIGTAETGADGVATLDVPPGYRGARHDFAASFAGDPFFLPAAAPAPPG